MTRIPQVRRRSPADLPLAAAAAVWAAVAIWAAAPARAANYFWDPAQTASTNGRGAGTWDKTLPNFFTGPADAPWVDGNTAVFNNAGGVVTLGVPISALNLQLLGTGYAIAPSATSTLTLTGGFNTTGAGATIYAGGLTGSVNTVNFSAAAGNTLNLTGTIAQTNINAAGLTIFGPGTVNYSGTAFTPGKFNVQGGATFNTSGAMTISANGTYTGVSDTVAGSTLIVSGGTLTAGTTLFLGNGTGTTGTYLQTAGAVTGFAAVNVGGGFNNTSDGTSLFTLAGGTFSTGAAAGNVRIGNAKAGVGVLNLNGGTLTTNDTIARGTSTGGTGTGGSGTINFNGGVLQAGGTNLTVANTLLANVLDGGVIVDTNGFAAAIAANLTPGGTGVGGLTKNGVGALVLSGTNTYNGNTAVNGGTLAASLVASLPGYNQTGRISVATGAAVSFGFGSPGAFQQADIQTALNNITFAPGSGIGLDVATGITATYGNNLGGFTNFVKTSAGTLILAGTDTDTGTSTLSGGLLAVGPTDSTGARPTGSTIVFNNGGIASSDATRRTISNVVSQTGTASFTFGGTATTTGPLTFTNATAIPVGTNAGRNFVVNVPTTLSQGFAGTGLTSTKSGTGTFILNGDSTGLTGTFTLAVGSGRTQLGNGNALGTAALVVNGAGTDNAQLALAGGITAANPVTLSTSRNDPTAAPPGTAHVVNVSGNNTITTSGFGINAGGAGNIFQSDAGTLTLAGNLVGNNASTSFNRPYYFTGVGNGVVSGNIADRTAATGFGATVVKYGTGSWTLSGANTYAGGTTVLNGTLVVSNTTASGTGPGTVSVGDGTNASTGVLAGTGTVGNGTNALTIQRGGTITGGTGALTTDAVGTLTTGPEAWNAGGTLVANFDAANANNDRLVLSGLTVANGFVVNVVGTSATAIPGGQYVLATQTSAAPGTDAFTLAALTFQVNGATAPASYALAEADNTGGGVDLLLTVAAPEPTSLLLAGLAAAPLVVGRRRCRRTGR